MTMEMEIGDWYDIDLWMKSHRNVTCPFCGCSTVNMAAGRYECGFGSSRNYIRGVCEEYNAGRGRAETPALIKRTRMSMSCTASLNHPCPR